MQKYTKPKNYFAYGDYDFASMRRMKSFFADFTQADAEILWNKHMILLIILVKKTTITHNETILVICRHTFA